ncbi:hypothetical protein TH53_13010 [Pedobacter lusitanus]|uniref:Uncharacterized protein n=1 Tax=Pedobacter lusitanus TaxID=1503925 RepID=A0A0D0GQB3_9SPHI|nr:hypothetical protein [Pedobacter lusitanus]KIO76746.1 hypothetical protein TH53_13010 [Pedobacter lusitanus]
MIIFGTGFYGKIEDYKNHWIETKFFHVFFIPLFPTSSMCVIDSSFRKRTGWDLALHSKSVKAAYGRFFTFIIAAFFLFWTFENGIKNFLAESIFGFAMTACWIYLYFFYGKPTAEEIQSRDKMASCTGLSVLPHWISFSHAESQLKFFTTVYQEKYPDSDWKADLKKGQRNPQQIKLLYTLALFNCMIFDTPENEELYYKADNDYQLAPQSSPDTRLAF